MHGYIAVAAVAALLTGMLAVPGAAQGIPGVPGLPDTEDLGPLVSADRARFKVVVEGRITASRASTLSTAPSGNPCAVTIDATVNETSTYERGRGARIYFERVRAGGRTLVTVNREGRRGDASLALTVTRTRTATGVLRRFAAAAVAPGTCPELNEDLAQGGKCGRPEQLPAMSGSLSYSRSVLRLRLTAGSGFIDDNTPDCGGDGAQSTLRWGLPSPVALAAEPLSMSAIFGNKRGTKRRVIVVRMTASAGPARQQSNISGFSGTVTDQGTNTAILRLVRIR